MPENKVQIIITTDASGTVTGFKLAEGAAGTSMKKIEADTSSFASKVKQHWLGISAAIIGIYATISKGFDLMELGAKAMQTEESFRSVTAAYRVHGDAMLEKMKQVSFGMVDDSDLMQRAVRGLQQGLKENQIVQILEISRGAARTASTDIVTAFDEITTASANQMTRGLKHMGIVIDQKKAMEDYAKTLHVNAAALTEQEQSQAIANAAIAEGTRQLQAFGIMSLNPAERIQILRAQIHELKETIGIGLVRAAFGAFGAFQYLAAGILGLTANVYALIAAYHSLAEANFFAPKSERESHGRAADLAADKSIGLWIERDKLTREAKKNFDAMTASSEDIGAAMASGNIKPPRDDAADAAKKIADLNKQIQDMIDKATLTPTEYIMKQAQAYIAEKRDQVLVAKWAQAEIDKIQDEAFKNRSAEEIKYKEYMDGEAKKNIDRQRAISEADISHQLALIDLQEKSFEISKKEAVSGRLNLYQQELDNLRQQYDETLGIADKDLERFGILSKIDDIQGKITDSLLLQKELTGTFAEGLGRGFKQYAIDLETNFQQGLAIAKQITQSMENAFMNFFDYTSEGFMKFGNLAKQVLNDIMREMLRLMVVKPLTGWLMSGIGNLLPASAPVSGGLVDTNFMANAPTWPKGHSGGLFMHEGGFVPSFNLPRYHNGLAPDERIGIFQTEEGILSRRGMKNLAKLNLGGTGGNNLTVNVPITVDSGNKKMISELRSEIEETTIRVIRRHS